MSTLRQLIGRFKLQWRGENHVVGWNMTAEEVIAFFLRQRKTTLVNIGVTSVGIGAVYPLAKSMGFTTTGIVTSLALDRDDISASVDHICFVADKQWGGNLPDSYELSPTSRAMVECSDILVGIGGGGISEAEMLAGKAQGKPVYFYPADKNHANAIRYAKQMGLPPPESFDSGNPDLFKK